MSSGCAALLMLGAVPSHKKSLEEVLSDKSDLSGMDLFEEWNLNKQGLKKKWLKKQKKKRKRKLVKKRGSS